MVEQRSPKPRAEGSSPSAPAKKKQSPFGDCFFFVRQNLSEARACRASSPSAAGGRCSEARMAQRSKYGVTLPYFGHRKRGCEATSSPFVYLRQSCGDNHSSCFTAILLAFPIWIKLRRTVFSVRRFFIFTPFFAHFVPHSSRNPSGTSSKKHQSQFKSVCNAHQHIRVSFDIIQFGYF